MLLSRRAARRAVAGAIGAGACAGAMLLSAPAALAEPPNCTAADLAGVSAGVNASTSAYLFTHPEVNEFFTDLAGQPKGEIRDDVEIYFDKNPTVKADLAGIRQPLIDLKTRCGGMPVAN